MGERDENPISVCITCHGLLLFKSHRILSSTIVVINSPLMRGKAGSSMTLHLAHKDFTPVREVGDGAKFTRFSLANFILLFTLSLESRPCPSSACSSTPQDKTTFLCVCSLEASLYTVNLRCHRPISVSDYLVTVFVLSSGNHFYDRAPRHGSYAPNRMPIVLLN